MWVSITNNYHRNYSGLLSPKTLLNDTESNKNKKMVKFFSKYEGTKELENDIS